MVSTGGVSGGGAEVYFAIWPLILSTSLAQLTICWLYYILLLSILFILLSSLFYCSWWGCPLQRASSSNGVAPRAANLSLSPPITSLSLFSCSYPSIPLPATVRVAWASVYNGMKEEEEAQVGARLSSGNRAADRPS